MKLPDRLRLAGSFINIEAAARIEALEAALERCANIVELNLYRQHEKIEDVPKIARTALKGTNDG